MYKMSTHPLILIASHSYIINQIVNYYLHVVYLPCLYEHGMFFFYLRHIKNRSFCFFYTCDRWKSDKRYPCLFSLWVELCTSNFISKDIEELICHLKQIDNLATILFISLFLSSVVQDTINIIYGAKKSN